MLIRDLGGLPMSIERLHHPTVQLLCGHGLDLPSQQTRSEQRRKGEKRAATGQGIHPTSGKTGEQ